MKPAPKDGQVVEREEPVVEEKKPIAAKDPEVEYARYVRRGVKGLVRSDLRNARTSNRTGVTDEIAIGMLRDQYAKPKQMREVAAMDRASAQLWKSTTKQCASGVDSEDWVANVLQDGRIEGDHEKGARCAAGRRVSATAQRVESCSGV